MTALPVARPTLVAPAQGPHTDAEPARVILEARDLVKRYDLAGGTVEAVRGVTLQVTAGEFVALMGSSGSGKSTLLHLLGGLDQPTHGDVTLEGAAISRLSDDAATKLRRERTGFVFQSFNLVPLLDVTENVGLPFTIAGQDPRSGEAGRLVKRGDRARRARRQGARPARPAEPGRAATGRRRACARHAARDPVRRRAHRQPRLHHGLRDPRCALALLRRSRPDDRPRDPRFEGGRLRRPRARRRRWADPQRDRPRAARRPQRGGAHRPPRRPGPVAADARPPAVRLAQPPRPARPHRPHHRRHRGRRRRARRGPGGRHRDLRIDRPDRRQHRRPSRPADHRLRRGRSVAHDRRHHHRRSGRGGRRAGHRTASAHRSVTRSPGARGPGHRPGHRPIPRASRPRPVAPRGVTAPRRRRAVRAGRGAAGAQRRAGARDGCRARGRRGARPRAGHRHPRRRWAGPGARRPEPRRAHRDGGPTGRPRSGRSAPERGDRPDSAVPATGSPGSMSCWPKAPSGRRSSRRSTRRSSASPTCCPSPATSRRPSARPRRTSAPRPACSPRSRCSPAPSSS